jgi:Cd2+/Zn2+-exporting ATPase
MALEYGGIDHRAVIATYALSIVSGGIYSVRRALHAARSLSLDINVLMLVAVCGAMVLGQWSEGAAVVFLFALAQLLEARAMERARGAIRALMDLTPAEALVRDAASGEFRRVAVDDISVGDLVVVRPGEKIPLDGRVAAGESHVNQAPVTGESLPAEKRVDDEVFAGTINGRGALDVRVTRLRGDSTLARIIHMVEQAQAQRAPSQTFVERFARIYTPAVLILALAIGILPPLVLGAGWSAWIYRALVLLVISCPCALVISTPVSVVSALAAAARQGVLIKGGAHLERLAKVRCIAFDKTGTLTKGDLRVVDVVPLNGAEPERILLLAASLERRSEHPIGAAIVARAREQGLTPLAVDQFQALPGLGAEAFVDGTRVVIGSHRLFDERGACSPDVHARIEEAALAAGGQTTVIVGAEAPIGVITVSDRPRESARDAVRLLREHGVTHVALLTGDHAAAARALGETVGVDEVRAGLLPAGGGRGARRRYGTLAMARRNQRRARARRRRHRDGRRRQRRRAGDRRRRAHGGRAPEDPLRAAPEPRHGAQRPREHRVLHRAQGRLHGAGGDGLGDAVDGGGRRHGGVAHSDRKRFAFAQRIAVSYALRFVKKCWSTNSSIAP